MDRFVRFADVATGNSFIDGTNGFVGGLLLDGYHLCWFRLSVLPCFGIVFRAVGLIVLYLLPLFALNFTPYFCCLLLSIYLPCDTHSINNNNVFLKSNIQTSSPL